MAVWARELCVRALYRAGSAWLDLFGDIFNFAPPYALGSRRKPNHAEDMASFHFFAPPNFRIVCWLLMHPSRPFAGAGKRGPARQPRRGKTAENGPRWSVTGLLRARFVEELKGVRVS